MRPEDYLRMDEPFTLPAGTYRLTLTTVPRRTPGHDPVVHPVHLVIEPVTCPSFP